MHDIMDHTNTGTAGSRPDGSKHVPALSCTDRCYVITSNLMISIVTGLLCRYMAEDPIHDS
jgi:hypothetical protein